MSKIISSPKILFGKPRVDGTRMSVEHILDCLSNGWSISQIVEEYPIIKEEDIYACIDYANKIISNTRIISHEKQKNALPC